MRYVWDEKKAIANRKKHGVPFEEAVTAFADRHGLIVVDDVHPERAILIGMSGRAHPNSQCSSKRARQ